MNIKRYWIKQRRKIKKVANVENRSMNTYKDNGFEESKMREKDIVKIVKKIRKCILKNKR